MKRTYSRLGALMGLAALFYSPCVALAQTAPALGVAQQFSVLGNSGVTGSTGAGTLVNGTSVLLPRPRSRTFLPRA
jgi:hypothetical protein